jgi:hypothetical protein
LLIVGWREWVALPDLRVPAIKTKVDTGAKTSSLHALDIEEFRKRGSAWLRFRVHPFQREEQLAVETEAELVEYRHVRSSNGHLTHRPVIVTTLQLLGEHWPIELTLTNRDEMGFRMLLGREALRGRVCVDPGHSYLSGKGPATAHERHLLTVRGRGVKRGRRA